MRIEPVDDDPIRQFTDEENKTLTHNLQVLTEQVIALGSKAKVFSLALLIGWHEQLFRDVRDHAGKPRSADYGEHYLNFGPNRSIAREEVTTELIKHERLVKELIDQLDRLEAQLTPESFVEEVIKAALYIHARLIGIHAFRDGNGRVARLLLAFFLSCYGLPSIILEIPKQEYLVSLNYFYKSSDLDPLLNLALRLYRNQL
jgi:fido (protein-threonine AMPylation protein)